MPRYIVKMEWDEKVRYMEWSTIVDAPVTYLMSLEEFTGYYREEYGRHGMGHEFEDRMTRVEETGTSAHLNTREFLFKHNRAGENGSALNEETIWRVYHDERPTGEEEA